MQQNIGGLCSHLFEKISEQRTYFGFQNAFFDLRFGVKQLGRNLRIAALFVACAVHQPPQLRPVQCARAHGARLQSYVQGAVFEVLTAQMRRRCGNGHYFGMGGYVVQLLGLVARLGNDEVLAYHHRPHGNFARLGSGLGFVNCQLHKIFVGIKRVFGHYFRLRLGSILANITKIVVHKATQILGVCWREVFQLRANALLAFSSKPNKLPASGWLSTHILPPCASMKSLEMASPNPVPELSE